MELVLNVDQSMVFTDKKDKLEKDKDGDEIDGDGSKIEDQSSLGRVWCQDIVFSRFFNQIFGGGGRGCFQKDEKRLKFANFNKPYY